ncbi:hypothetical protein [Paenibacillus senegalimassiliensis]|uniref:hypothetical protein n=1 Tax=Paenibacillus senegalimassiliensis TaxID=1737426 RepID=UPI001652A32A|nr:hypothetical protein [Paenibacillus senegalimassiliensis]
MEAGEDLFHVISLIIPAVVLLPNFLFWAWPPEGMPSSVQAVQVHLGLKVAEGAGRVGVMVVPLFYGIHMNQSLASLALVIMIIAMLLYSVGWVRYLRQGRRYYWLFAPLWGIPVPMAIMPVLYFLASSLLLESIPMLVSAIILGIGHIPSSLQIYRNLEPGQA